MMKTRRRCFFLLFFSLIFFPAVCWAGPLTDFSPGSGSVDISRSLHTFEGSNNSYELAATAGLGNGWAVNFRQSGYSPIHNSIQYDTINREANIIRKLDDHWQVYAGYSRTKGSGNNRTMTKGVVQGGVIGNWKLSDKTAFFVNFGGGLNVTNVEFGFSHELQKNLELNAVYRHLSVEKMPANDDKMNLRDTSLSLTYKW